MHFIILLKYIFCVFLSPLIIHSLPLFILSFQIGLIDLELNNLTKVLFVATILLSLVMIALKVSAMLFLSVCLSICLSACLSVCLFVFFPKWHNFA